MSREGGVIEREVFIAAPPETVFKFLTDAQFMAHWLGSFQQLDPRPGGVLSSRSEPRQHRARRIHGNRSVPPRGLHMGMELAATRSCRPPARHVPRRNRTGAAPSWPYPKT